MDLSEKTFLEYLQGQVGKEDYKNPSPYGNWLGCKLLSVDITGMSVEFIVRKDMTNPIGILHGGVIAGIIDDTIGMTVAVLGFETYSVSTNLSIDFLSSGKIGDRLIATSIIIRQGQNMVNTECKIVNLEGKIIAKGTANLFRTHILKKK